MPREKEQEIQRLDEKYFYKRLAALSSHVVSCLRVAASQKDVARFDEGQRLSYFLDVIERGQTKSEALKEEFDRAQILCNATTSYPGTIIDLSPRMADAIGGFFRHVTKTSVPKPLEVAALVGDKPYYPSSRHLLLVNSGGNYSRPVAN